MEYNLFRMRKEMLESPTLAQDDLQALKLLDEWYEGLSTEGYVVDRLVKLNYIAKG